MLGMKRTRRDITTRKTAEAELRRSQAQLAEAQRIAHLGSWEWDILQDRVTWSDELYRIYGVAPQEFEASFEGFLALVHPDDRSYVDGCIQRGFREGKSFEFEHRIIQPDGAVRMVQGRGKVLRDALGNPVRMVGTAQDVTAMKEAEARAQQLSHEQAARAAAERDAARLAAIQTVTDVALAHLELDDLLTELLDRICQLLAADTAVILLLEDGGETLVARAAKGLEETVAQRLHIPVGEGFAGRIAAQRKPVIIDDIDQAVVLNPLLRKKGVRSLLGTPLLAHDQVIGVMHVGTLQPYRFTEDDVRMFLVVSDRVAFAIERARLYDVERRARAEAQAAQQRSAFLTEASTLLSSSLDYEPTLQSVARLAVPQVAAWCAVHILDDDNHLRALAMAHADPAKVERAWALQRRYPPHPNAPRGVWHVIRTGEAELYPEISDTELAAVAHDAEHLEILRGLGLRSAMIVPIRASGRTLGALTFIAAAGRSYGAEDLALAQDLAYRAALAVENARHYRAAQNAVRARDEFLSIAAHELKTPLTSLRGFAQVATRQLDKAGRLDPLVARQTLVTINEQSQKLSQLVSQLLDISRIDSGKLRLDRQETDLAGLAESVAAAARATTSYHVIVVRAAAAVRAAVDPLRFEQVLSNLVNNAVKYSPAGGCIEIELSLAGPGAVQLVVQDQGTGVPPDHRPHIFDRFYQAQRLGGASGMGLGLYISRQIVELHGGTIGAEFPPEGGTRMVVRIPAAVEATPLPNRETETAPLSVVPGG